MTTTTKANNDSYEYFFFFRFHILTWLHLIDMIQVQIEFPWHEVKNFKYSFGKFKFQMLWLQIWIVFNFGLVFGNTLKNN